MRNIIIYRHQLFKPSEGFIFQQTKYLLHHHPLFVGRKVEGLLPQPSIAVKTLPLNYLHLVRHVLFRNPHVFSSLLQQEKPALIHAHFGVEGVYALPLAKTLNTPLITTFHGFDATTNRKGLLLSGKVSWLNYLAFRSQLAKEGDLFLCVSHFIRDKLLQLGFPAERLVTHYIGVDIDLIQPQEKPKNEKIILHVARLVEVKGTRYLLDAFSILLKKGMAAKLVIIGDGPLKQVLQDYAHSLAIGPWVQFLGVQTPAQVIEWMNKASLFCLPSVQTRQGNAEALGMVLAEAAACQLPIVATQHGGIPEIVKNDLTGFLVPEKNAAVLAERLIYLLENESLSAKMGVAGRAFIEQEFNLRLQTEKLEKIYQEI